mmetsp:Transcript_48771/g.75985  ORF Transcript_48771/g.75985 Transcript_48771/m.75985 type:complete len:165 (+) Transcript_48771:132-626(+)
MKNIVGHRPQDRAGVAIEDAEIGVAGEVDQEEKTVEIALVIVVVMIAEAAAKAAAKNCVGISNEALALVVQIADFLTVTEIEGAEIEEKAKARAKIGHGHVVYLEAQAGTARHRMLKSGTNSLIAKKPASIEIGLKRIESGMIYETAASKFMTGTDDGRQKMAE